MVEKSDEFDEWILNRHSFPHQILQPLLFQVFSLKCCIVQNFNGFDE